MVLLDLTRDEFRAVTKEISSNMEFDVLPRIPKPNVKFTYPRTSGSPESRAAAIVDIRDIQRIDDGHIDRLYCLRNSLLEKGYCSVFAYVLCH